MAVPFPSVRVAIKDAAESSTSQNRPVGRLDPRPLQSPPPDVAHTATLRGFFVILSAVERSRGKQTVRCQMLGTTEVAKVAGLLTGDGGALILATILHFPKQDADIHLFKVDAAGNELWSRTWSEG